MRTILVIIRKEFVQIFRNKAMLPIIFVMPVIQLLILAQAATYEIRNITVEVVDQDRSAYSREFLGRFEASEYFTIQGYAPSEKAGKDALQAGRADLLIVIPPHFEKELVADKTGSVLFALDAIDGATAAVINGYASQVAAGFSEDLRSEWLGGQALSPPITVIPRYWFNPELKYTNFMVPGILVLLVTMVSMLLAGMNIVREKEVGTIEQLNVTPLKKYQFITGKLSPFWILGMVELAFGLFIGWWVFRIPIEGSVPLVFGFAGVYLLLILGMGLFISTFANTQQQSMFLTWFFLVIFILMSGLFTPIESMPPWAQKITLFNPIRYFVEVMRMVLLKGAGFGDIQKHFIILTAYAVGMNVLAVLNYRKRVG